MGVKLWWMVPLAIVTMLMANLHTPLPNDAKEPWKLQASLVGFKTTSRLAWLGNVLGMGSSMNLTRKLMESITLEHPSPKLNVLQVKDIVLDGIPVRLYTPLGDKKELKGIVHIHGGGWSVLSIDSYDAYVRLLAEQSNAVVISINFRLSPEHPYPMPLEDCVRASKYFLKHAAEFGVDADRVAITGDSAGGNLAMATSMKIAEDITIPHFKKQILAYPALQAVDFNTPSYQEYSESERLTHTFCTKEELIKYWQSYVFGDFQHTADLFVNNHTSKELKKLIHSSILNHDHLPKKNLGRHYKGVVNTNTNNQLAKDMESIFNNPYVSPLISSDAQIGNQPHTYIITAEYDTLRDDGFFLAHRLNQLGLPFKHDHYDGIEHGFLMHLYYDIHHVAMDRIKVFLSDM